MIKRKASIQELVLIGKELESDYNELARAFMNEVVINKDINGDLEKGKYYYTLANKKFVTLESLHKIVGRAKGVIEIEGLNLSSVENLIRAYEVKKDLLVNVYKGDMKRYEWKTDNDSKVIFNKEQLAQNIEMVNKKLIHLNLLKSKIEIMEEIEIEDIEILKLLS